MIIAPMPPQPFTLAAQIVSHNEVSPEGLPKLIESVRSALSRLGKEPIAMTERAPAVPIKQSVFSNDIICLEDGRKLKMLKRHLRVTYGMALEEYRARWRLPADYPRTAPNYRLIRSNMAKRIGLGKTTVRDDRDAAAADE